MSHSHSFSKVLDQLQSAEEGKKTNLGNILEAFSFRGFGPLLLIPSLFVMIPIIGGIPGAPTLGALVIILISIQIVIGKKSPWAPQRLCDIKLSGEKLDKAIKKIKPLANWLDKYTGKRFTLLTHPSSIKIVALLCILLAGLMVPLELVPMGVVLPSVVITVFSLGLTAKDGILIGLGYLLTLTLIASSVYLWW